LSPSSAARPAAQFGWHRSSDNASNPPSSLHCYARQPLWCLHRHKRHSAMRWSASLAISLRRRYLLQNTLAAPPAVRQSTSTPASRSTCSIGSCGILGWRAEVRGGTYSVLRFACSLCTPALALKRCQKTLHRGTHVCVVVTSVEVDGWFRSVKTLAVRGPLDRLTDADEDGPAPLFLQRDPGVTLLAAVLICVFRYISSGIPDW
jgi:hypothetical protein